MTVVTGSSHSQFAQHLAQLLNVELVTPDLTIFKNTERKVRVPTSLKNETVILVQSLSDPVDTHLIEYLLITDALERVGVEQVWAVVPWLGYSMQDKVFQPGEPIAAKVVANLISNAFTHRVFLLDLHNSSIPGFFSVPTHHLSADEVFEQYIRDTFNLKETIVVSPDFGGLKRARVLADRLGVELANIDKHRNLSTGQVEHMELHGNVENKTVLVYDDVILSGGTVGKATQVLKSAGAKQVYFLATHGLFVGSALETLQSCQLNGIITTDSIHHNGLPDSIKQLSIGPVFAEVLQK